MDRNKQVSRNKETGREQEDMDASTSLIEDGTWKRRRSLCR